jgi:apolipoprotein N-acyltransferase
MVMLITGTSLFMAFYPTFMCGLAILLVCVLIDVLWINITINNNLGRLHFLGVPVLLIGLLAMGATRGSLIDFFGKTLSFILILLGAFGALSLLRKAD